MERQVKSNNWIFQALEDVEYFWLKKCYFRPYMYSDWIFLYQALEEIEKYWEKNYNLQATCSNLQYILGWGSQSPVGARCLSIMSTSSSSSSSSNTPRKYNHCQPCLRSCLSGFIELELNCLQKLTAVQSAILSFSLNSFSKLALVFNTLVI